MSGTGELTRLLDERGEDYISDQHSVTWAYYTDPHTATESMDGTLIVTGLTPEQAIAATLGGGECVITPIAPGSDMGWCSACEQVADVHSNYCWKCGAKAVKR